MVYIANMRLPIRQGLFFLVLAGWLTGAAAMEPVVGLLWSLVQDRLLSAAAAYAERSAQDPGFVSRPSGELQLREVKNVIDENFSYLSPGQRDEIYADLARVVTDPKHAASRDFMIEQFTQTAQAMGEAHRRLNNLSHAEKQRVASDIRLAYERSPARERDELLKLVRSHQLPLPGDLNQMVLDELDHGARGAGE